MSDFLSKALGESGYFVDVVATGGAGVTRLLSSQYALGILDVMLPDMDGFQVLEAVRGRGELTPVLMLTARNAVDDRVRGLDSGADDYLPKPFELAELLARVRVLLRRKESAPHILSAGGITLDPGTRKVMRDDKRIELSAKEFALLEYFMRNQGRVLSKAMILDRVWEDQFERESNVVEVYINYLRRKVGPNLIHTMRGAGYVLERR